MVSTEYMYRVEVICAGCHTYVIYCDCQVGIELHQSKCQIPFLTLYGAIYIIYDSAVHLSSIVSGCTSSTRFVIYDVESTS